MNITGPQAAFFGHVYGVQSSVDDVFAFYDRELANLGWKPDARPIPTTTELDGWGWCKPQLYFRLVLYDPQQYDRLGVGDGAQYRAVLDARVQGTTQGCPRSQASR